MKIAVTYDAGEIFQHFGKSKTFAVYEVEQGAVKGRTLLDAGENGHSALVGLLAGQGVTLLICGGIGPGARDALAGQGIELVAGASGPVDDAVAAYLNGQLRDNPAGQCNHHHEGEEHSCHDGGAHHCNHSHS